MTTAEKSEKILLKIVELCNENSDKQVVVGLGSDFGGNSLTIFVNNAHTHVGDSSGTWDSLVDSLYNSLHGGPGLSWAKE